VQYLKAIVLNIPGRSGLPSLSDNEIARIGELDRVTVVVGAEVHIAARLVVLVVVLAGHQTIARAAEFKVGGIGIWIGGWGGKRANGRRESDREVSEGNHNV